MKKSKKDVADFKIGYLRMLPSVNSLIERLERSELSACPHVLLVEAAQEVLATTKKLILSAKNEDEIQAQELSMDKVATRTRALAIEKNRMSIRRAINATGEILSEKLGRSPLNDAAQKALLDVAGGYCTIATDIETGAKADRDIHIQHILSLLTDSEAALVVNNNAAAVMLMLNTFACGKEVIVSRGQLVENDGFRLPDIIEKSGAVLVSVGATNKTHFSDYRSAVNENTGAILQVHRSNFRIAGFSQDVPLQELAELSKEQEIPLLVDAGSGSLVDLAGFGIREEPSVSIGIRNGADVVCFSGDKLLGGPQAGVMIGKARCISAMNANSLYRVFRAGKLPLAALEATLRSYLDKDGALKNNPVLQLIIRDSSKIEEMASSLARSAREALDGLAAVEVEDSKSPFVASKDLPTKLVLVTPSAITADELASRLRKRPTPVFARVRAKKVIFDLRTVKAEELQEVVEALKDCCN